MFAAPNSTCSGIWQPSHQPKGKVPQRKLMPKVEKCLENIEKTLGNENETNVLL